MQACLIDNEDRIHTVSATAIIASQGDDTGREILGKQSAGGIRSNNLITGVSEIQESRGCSTDVDVIAEVNGYILVDVKTKESITCTTLVIIGGFDIRGALETVWNFGKSVRSVNIDEFTDLHTILDCLINITIADCQIANCSITNHNTEKVPNTSISSRLASPSLSPSVTSNRMYLTLTGSKVNS